MDLFYILEYASAVQASSSRTRTGAQAEKSATDSYNKGVSWYTALLSSTQA